MPEGVDLSITNYPTTSSVPQNMAKFGFTNVPTNSALLLRGYRGVVRAHVEQSTSGSIVFPVGQLTWLSVNKAVGKGMRR